MNDTTVAPRATIRARIHESAVKRVTRTYAATLPEILAETLQNARRAGATRIRIAVDAFDAPNAGDFPGGDRPSLSVTVADDGAGIADPAVLLSFGENGWPDDLVRREDAAGFGFASLARRGCAVSSRPRSPSGDTRPGWRVDLAPEHFLGEAEADVRPEDAAPFPHGTTVAFPATEPLSAIRNAAAAAARHHPLPVLFADRTEGGTSDGEPLPRRAFLDGAVHAETWRGLAFGVFRNRNAGWNDPDLNFLGLTLAVRLPTVETVHGATWTVRADVQDCPDLELVLPARKEAVETGFLKDMREAARLAVYRAMAADPSPCPTFADQARARRAGIDIAPPPAMLRPWRPALADADDWRDPPKLAMVGQDALVMDFDPDPPEAHALWRAAVRTGISCRLFEADRRLAGYGWHDSLDRVTAMSVQVAADGAWTAISDLPAPERTDPSAAPLPPRPAAIRIALTVRRPTVPPATLDLPADLAFAGKAWSWIEDALPLVTADSDLSPHRLADVLAAAFFAPCDDSASDSHETQRQRFDDDALHLATRLLLSDADAVRTSIADAARRELLWLCPKDRAVTIRIARPEVSVTLADANPES